MVLDNIVLVVGVIGIATIVRSLIGARSQLKRVARHPFAVHESSQTKQR